MNNPFNSDEEMLARLVREAGDPSVAPDPQYAETLRATILDRVGSAGISKLSTLPKEEETRVVPNIVERVRKMKHIAKLAVAVTIFVALGILVSWMMIGGGSTNIAFADVAKALDGLRTATYDFTSEMKNPMDGKMTTNKSKGFFLAPGRERCEMSMGSGKDKSSGIMILDCLAAKGLTLVPEQKLAIVMNISTTEKSAGGTSHMFDMVRRLVQEGGSGPGEKVESLGKKEIDGRVAFGFRTRSNMADVTLWADSLTARLVRVDIDYSSGGGRSVMSNFRYDMELDPSLFSLEPPAGYTVQTQTVTMPVEEDLVNILRLIAEHNNGSFPSVIGQNKEYMHAIQAASQSEAEKLFKTPETQKLMNELKAKYGKDQPGFMKAWMKEWMKMIGPLTQKHMKGMMFYGMLKPENDSHYVGGGVKLGTPNRPIFWYKPTGTDKYRVIYADLSVKEATSAEIKSFPEASKGYTEEMRSIDAAIEDEKHFIEMLRVYAAAQNGLLPLTLDASDVESGIKAPMEKEIEAKYGKSREARMKAMQDVEFMKRFMAPAMKCGRGFGFLRDLKPENDSHYAGKDVKLGTPDRPIFWYKPTGSDKYRVIYADLSVKDMTPDDVKKLPEAKTL